MGSPSFEYGASVEEFRHISVVLFDAFFLYKKIINDYVSNS